MKIAEKRGMSKMEIMDAKQVFQEWGDSLTPGYETIIDLNIVRRSQKGFNNDNYCHALFFTDYMFRKAQHSICMLTGGISNNGFLDILFNSFSEAVKRIAEKGGEVKLITLGPSICDRVDKLREQFKNTLFIEPALTTSGGPLPHFIICDDKMVRDEQIHGELSDKTDANEVKAMVYFNNQAKATVKREKFEGYWKALREAK